MSSACVPTFVVEFWEQLFEDETSKDVKLKARDGSVRVHSLILSQMSAAFKAMLNAGMSEERTKTINLDNFSTAQLKFVLRLMYTGQIDSSDWSEQTKPVRIWKKNMRGNEVPLSVLMGSLSFAKQYEIPTLVSGILDHIRLILWEGNFNKIMQHAIAIDMSPLKLMCMDYAKKSSTIKDMFDDNQLSTEVTFELQALWTAPPRKKARTYLCAQRYAFHDGAQRQEELQPRLDFV